jgi:hypothetical protein
MKKLILTLLICVGNFGLHAQTTDKAKPADKKPATVTQNAVPQQQTGTQTDKKAPGVRPKPIPAEQAKPGTQPKPGNSQSTARPQDDRKMKKDGTPDKRYKENKHVKKDGTPDQRFKENKAKDTKTAPASQKSQSKK